MLAELRRLVPGQDPVAVLLADPSGCLDMQVRRGAGSRWGAVAGRTAAVLPLLLLLPLLPPPLPLPPLPLPLLLLPLLLLPLLLLPLPLLPLLLLLG